MNKKKDKLWIYSELFYPEETSTSYIMTKIANKLASKFDVEVISGYPSYDKNENSDFLVLDERIKLKRIKSYSGNKDKTLPRIIKLVSLSFGFFFHLLFKVKSGDKIFTVTNPATFLVFASFIKIFKKLDITILVHDVFPENTIAAGFIKNQKDLKYNIFKKIFNNSYSRIDQLIVLGRDMAEIFIEKLKEYRSPPKITIIENWTETDNIFPVKNVENAKNKIVFQFAGNLGSIQGLDSIIKIIENVKNPALVFDFIGDGKMKPFLQDYVNEKSIKNVFFQPSYPRSQQNLVLNSCDIAIVSLSDNMLGLGVPSKTYNILAAGKPILYIGDKNSEVALLIKEYDIGFHFDYSEKNKLLDFFDKLNLDEIESIFLQKGQNARKIAEEKFSEEIILNKFIEAI